MYIVQYRLQHLLILVTTNSLESWLLMVWAWDAYPLGWEYASSFLGNQRAVLLAAAFTFEPMAWRTPGTSQSLPGEPHPDPSPPTWGGKESI